MTHQTTTDETVDDLEFVGPSCPECGYECGGDGDSWWCEGTNVLLSAGPPVRWGRKSCGLTWDHDGTNGQRV